MVAPILLSVSFISTALFAYLYYKGEGKRKDLVAKFKTTRDYAEKLSKSLSNLELKNRALSLQVSSLQEKAAAAIVKGAMLSAPQVNGVAKPTTDTQDKKPRKRGPRRKNNNNDNK